MSAASIDVSCVIKHISDRIGDYDKPESLMEWCRKAMKDYSPRSLKLMRISVHNNLNRIEKLEGYSLMEKLQLVFIFSRPVRDGFVQLLKDAKFKIKQDEKKRISRFSTEDGSIVRFSDHHPGVKYFQGVLCQNTPWQKSANKDRIARENEGGQEDVEKNNTNPEMDEELESMEQVQEEIDEDNPVELEPKQEADEDMAVGVDFGQGAFNGCINYEELDAQEFVYPGFPGEMKPETSVRLQKRGQNPTTENGKRVKTSDSIATPSNQKKCELKDANFEISQDKEKRISRFSTADGRIVRFSDHKHYDKYFEGVYCQTGKRKGYREVRGIEEEAGAAGYPGIERKLRSYQQEDVRQEAFSGPLNYDELDEQEWINPRFSKRVKMEYGSPAQAPNTQAKISVISLVTHIETIAMYFDLDNLQNKASLAIKRMENSGENKTLSVKKFNSLIDALLICIEENRVRRNDTSIPLKSILKHLQLYLIRPLGSEEALESISQKIQEIGGNNDDGVPPNLISESLAHLLMAIGFYNQLES